MCSPIQGTISKCIYSSYSIDSILLVFLAYIKVRQKVGISAPAGSEAIKFITYFISLRLLLVILFTTKHPTRILNCQKPLSLILVMTKVWREQGRRRKVNFYFSYCCTGILIILNSFTQSEISKENEYSNKKEWNSNYGPVAFNLKKNAKEQKWIKLICFKGRNKI